LERSKLIVDYPDDSASDTEPDNEETEGLNPPSLYVMIIHIWNCIVKKMV
jgi:hypothetical protein